MKLSMVALFATVVCVAGCFDTSPVPRVIFESLGWKEVETLTCRNKRSEMIDDLLTKELILKKTRPEVIRLLGEPSEDYQLEGFELTYLIGPDRGYGIDFEWLGIGFDTKGKSCKAEVIVR